MMTWLRTAWRRFSGGIPFRCYLGIHEAAWHKHHLPTLDGHPMGHKACRHCDKSLEHGPHFWPWADLVASGEIKET